MRQADITTVAKGDIVRFKSFALRVECEPAREGNFVVLKGRISTNGCPLVTRKYLAPLTVSIDE